MKPASVCHTPGNKGKPILLALVHARQTEYRMCSLAFPSFAPVRSPTLNRADRQKAAAAHR